MKKSIIIDCDTGTDDAIAIVCAHRCKDLDIRAITTVAGNVSLKNTSQNTLNLVDYIGWDIRVAKGATKPLFRDLETADCHGDTGLGDLILPKSNRNFYDKLAMDLIYEEAKSLNGELEILAIGPLTNIALCILTYPEVKKLIKRITIMGGATVGGNMNAAAEFNMFVDPEAAKIVFESGIPITMVGLDVTLKTKLTLEDRNLLSEYNNPHAEVIVKLLDYMFMRSREYGLEDAVMHDGLALASMVLDDVVKTNKYYVTVETKGEFTTGQTVVDYYYAFDKEKNVDVALNVDVDMFRTWVKELASY